MYSPSIPRKRVFAVLVRWLCRHFCVRTLWGQDNWAPAMVYLRFSGYCFKMIFTWYNVWQLSNNSVSGLASLLRERFLLSLQLSCKNSIGDACYAGYSKYAFFILTNRLLKIYTYAVAQPTLTEITLFFSVDWKFENDTILYWKYQYN